MIRSFLVVEYAKVAAASIKFSDLHHHGIWYGSLFANARWIGYKL